MEIKNYTIISLVFFAAVVFLLLFSPPINNIYYPQVFIVEKGEDVSSVAHRLKEKQLISSESLFILSNKFFGGKILWGTYKFTGPKGVFIRSYELYSGNKNIPFASVTIPEGSNLYEISKIFNNAFENFDEKEFLEKAIEKHGYLYPETYLFSKYDSSIDHLIEAMIETFYGKNKMLLSSYRGNLTEREIITLASIVELESSRSKDRRKIASVLLNRLEEGIPLQVDVSFLFISGKNTFDLSREDLSIDDPSNTYKYSGIPPIPITNPTYDSIYSVIKPTKTDYLYFLADFYGNTHFSNTYDEHLFKKRKYIDNVVRDNVLIEEE